MAEASSNRRLAAILAADVVGYSRMMAADEAGTHAALRRHREAVFDPTVAANHGRIVKLIGDGTLAEFASVVDAVNCAVAIQRILATAVETGPKITLRIGVNLGDIIIDGEDIYGDGVNVAARLEPLAEPGGICISAIVNDSVGTRVDVAFRDGGEVQVKNIDRPVRVWKWHPDHDGRAGSAPAASAHGETAVLPALAVLPFQNMSGDPEQEYFADGVVEDLTTGLSRFNSFTVVSRNSSFVYKGRAVDVREVTRALGCQYVVEGSVRRSGDRLRVTAQLIAGVTGQHLWANNYDGSVADIFEVQDRITESIVAVIEPKIQQAEIERSRRERPESLDAYDLYLRALQQLNTNQPEGTARAYEFAKRVIALDPGYAPALALAAQCIEHRMSMGWPPMTGDDRANGLRLARSALALVGDDAMVLARGSYVVLRLGEEYEQSLQTLKRAIEINPNNLGVRNLAGISHMIAGKLDEALIIFERTMRLSPRDNHEVMAGVAHVHMFRGEYEVALQWAERGLAADPSYNPNHWIRIAANAQLGRMEEARRALAALNAVAPGITIASLSQLHVRATMHEDKVLRGLRLAGMPEA